MTTPVCARGTCLKWRAGFTLLELLMVLGIIGITAAIALPQIDYTRFRVDSSMRAVGSSLLGAQRLAVTRQHDVIILIDQNSHSFRIVEDANNNGRVDDGERTRGIPLGEQVVIGRGGAPAFRVGASPVTFTKQVGGIPALTFHRNGSASEAGGVYLTSVRATKSSSYNSDTRLVEVERATGRVMWYRFVSSNWNRGF